MEINAKNGPAQKTLKAPTPKQDHKAKKKHGQQTKK
jgi:hypothetical protein